MLECKFTWIFEIETMFRATYNDVKDGKIQLYVTVVLRFWSLEYVFL